MSNLNRKLPAYKPGLFALSFVSIALGVFGSAGWVLSDADNWTRALLGFVTVAAACVIPLTIVALGRSAASLVLLAPIVVFGAIGAYSFHHAVGTLIEGPRLAAHVDGLAPLAQVVATAQDDVARAKARLDAFPAAKVADCLCPQTKAADLQIWKDQRAPLAAALDAAKAELAQARAAHDAAVKAYTPLAPDLFVWIVGGALDIAIALGMWGLEATARDLARRQKNERHAAAKARATQKKAAARKATTKNRIGRGRAGDDLPADFLRIVGGTTH